MSLRFVAIEKEMTFQGRTERWSNVYCFDTNAADETAYAALVTGVVNAEKPVHASNVSFKKGRVYTTSGLNGITDPGNMYYVTDLTAVGTGVNSGSGAMYRECAVLVKWPLPRKVGLLGSLGRQRSLKKWIHPGAGLSLTTNEIEGTAALSSTAKAPFVTYASAVQVPVSGSQIVSPDGTLPNAAAQIHNYLEHRQFPRGRKES